MLTICGTFLCDHSFSCMFLNHNILIPIWILIVLIWETSRNKLKNCSNLSLSEQIVLAITKCLPILGLQPPFSKKILTVGQNNFGDKIHTIFAIYQTEDFLLTCSLTSDTLLRVESVYLSSFLPKYERKIKIISWLEDAQDSDFHSFFGRIYNITKWFRDLPTFSQIFESKDKY